MKDFRQRIIDRAYFVNDDEEIVAIHLSEDELETLNARVNSEISNGTHEFDSLDKIHMYLAKIYGK